MACIYAESLPAVPKASPAIFSLYKSTGKDTRMHLESKSQAQHKTKNEAKNRLYHYKK